MDCYKSSSIINSSAGKPFQKRYGNVEHNGKRATPPPPWREGFIYVDSPTYQEIVDFGQTFV
jgi:hypothetical protein